MHQRLAAEDKWGQSMDSTQVCGSLLGAGLLLALVLGARNFRRARKTTLETLGVSELDLRPPQAELTESTAPRCGSAELLALPELFLLKEENRRFIRGETQRRETSVGTQNSCLFIAIISLALVITALFAVPAIIVTWEAVRLSLLGETTRGIVCAEGVGGMLFAWTLPLVVGWIIPYMVLRDRRYRCLTEHGLLLQGCVVGCQVNRPKGHPTGPERFLTWVVKLEYRFDAPDGRVILATKCYSSCTKPDWHTTVQGKPVAVLYLNDKSYDVL
jgi:hypothetical protein